MTSHGKAGTAETHVRISGVGAKGARSEDRNIGVGGVVRRSEDTNLGVGGIGRSEDINLGVGGITNVVAKDDKSCVAHGADRSTGTYGKEHRHKHELGQMGMGNGQWQSI